MGSRIHKSYSTKRCKRRVFYTLQVRTRKHVSYTSFWRCRKLGSRNLGMRLLGPVDAASPENSPGEIDVGDEAGPATHRTPFSKNDSGRAGRTTQRGDCDGLLSRNWITRDCGNAVLNTLQPSTWNRRIRSLHSNKRNNKRNAYGNSRTER